MEIKKIHGKEIEKTKMYVVTKRKREQVGEKLTEEG